MQTLANDQRHQWSELLLIWAFQVVAAVFLIGTSAATGQLAVTWWAAGIFGGGFMLFLAANFKFLTPLFLYGCVNVAFLVALVWFIYGNTADMLVCRSHACRSWRAYVFTGEYIFLFLTLGICFTVHATIWTLIRDYRRERRELSKSLKTS